MKFLYTLGNGVVIVLIMITSTLKQIFSFHLNDARCACWPRGYKRCFLLGYSFSYESTRYEEVLICFARFRVEVMFLITFIIELAHHLMDGGRQSTSRCKLYHE